MPYFIAFVLAAGIGFYAWSKLRAELRKLDEQEKSASKSPSPKGKKKGDGVETLKRDPKTGVYRIDDE